MLIKYTHGKIALLFCLMQVLLSTVNEILPYSPQRVIIFLFVLFECIYTFLVRRQTRPSWFCYMIFWGTVSVFCILCGSNMMEDLTDSVYMITTILILELMQDPDVMDQVADFASESRQKILLILWLSLLVIGISVFYPDGYEADGSFRGFMYGSHSMASTVIVIMSIVVLCIDARGGRIRHFFCSETLIMGLSFMIIVYTRGRTFLVPAAVLLWRYLKSLPFVKYQKTIVAIFISACVTILFWNQIIEKFIETFNNPYAKNTMAAITNFRSELWACDFEHFITQSPLRMIFGNGFSFVRQLHEDQLYARLWSHNDFTYLLIGTGITGLGVYFSALTRSAGQFRRRKGSIVYFFAMVIFPMLINGFYIYIHLVWAYFAVFAAQHARDRLLNMKGAANDNV